MIQIALCGGSGTRLWPISTEERPKPFIPILAGTTLFRQTLLRNERLCDELLIAANVRHAELVNRQMGESGDDRPVRALWETEGRNTAAAVAIACMAVPPDEIVLITPCDHYIPNEASYERAIGFGIAWAQSNDIVAFGVTPLKPSTEYGYLIPDNGGMRFIEKPSMEQAIQLHEEGNCYWNSGIYMCSAGVLLRELRRLCPDLWEACTEVFRAGYLGLDQSSYVFDTGRIPAVSIDRAVMEKTDRLRMAPMKDTGWTDLGSFESLGDVMPKDELKAALSIRPSIGIRSLSTNNEWL